MKILIKWTIAFLAVVVFLATGIRVNAQDLQFITGTQVEYLSGKQLTITASLAEGVNVGEALVFVRSQNDTNTISGSAVIEPGRIVYIQDLDSQPLKAFTTIDYWFSITLPDGTRQESPVFSFFYDDNRFAWKTRQDGLFRLHWYEGDDEYAQMILDVAHAGYANAQSYITYPELDKIIDIYVYANSSDLNSLSQFYGPVMVIGHADPPLSLMTVLVPTGPGDRMTAQQVVAHELVHILLYRKVGLRYPNLPTWLNEGLAMLNEGSDSDFYTSLQDAASTGTLIPMSQLCNGFPMEGNSYILSYAQSYYFVRYLYQTFGSSRLEALISLYADGIGCEIAPQSILGSSLAQVDADWKEQISQYNNVEVDIASPVYPWLVVAAVILFAPVLLIIFGVLRFASQK